jgi:DNA invertase Pin-like site-specific DNA recombinase
LVARTFHGRYPKGKELHHKDNNKLNNKACNLSYVTHSENLKAACNAGYAPKLPDNRGERHGMSKITNKAVKQIRMMHKKGYSQSSIASTFGLSQPWVSRILSGQAWRHVR